MRLAILALWIKIEGSSAAMWSMDIDKSGWQVLCFGALCVIRRRRWCSGPRWRPLRWRCAHAFTPWACLLIDCCAILARMEAICSIFVIHCQVSFNRSPHLVMPAKHNTLHPLSLVFGSRFLDQMLCFLFCGAWKPSLGHFVNIQGSTQFRLLKLYPTSFSCHRSWHVENLQEISYSF